MQRTGSQCSLKTLADGGKMLNVFLKLIAAATAAAIAEALLPDGGAKGGIACGAMKLISFALAAAIAADVAAIVASWSTG
jgi:hypothetical protein